MTSNRSSVGPPSKCLCSGKKIDGRFRVRVKALRAASVGWNFVTAPLVGAALGYGIQKFGWVSLLAASLGAMAINTVSFAMAIAIGGVLGLGNFFGADIYFARVFRREGSGVKWWHHVLYGARFVALLALVSV